MSALPTGRPSAPISAPRGTALSCKGWLQEAALRMLMNNLDPDVAERWEDLVVYGGSGKAARDWPAFHRIVATLRTLEADETLLVQSGKPVGVFRTHPDAPRVLIANALLVPAWADWAHFRQYEAQGLTMYGQMTAGSWIYIGTQGILQGTYETFAACARCHFGGTLRGRLVLSAGLGGMGGAQPLAVTMNGGVGIFVEVDRDRIERRLPPPLRGPRDGLRRRGGPLGRGGARRGRAAVHRAPRERRRDPPGARPPRRAVRRGHRPDVGPRHAERLRPDRASRPSRRRRLRRRDARRATRAGATRRSPLTCARCSSSSARARSSSTTATTSAARPRTRALRDFAYPGLRARLHPAALLRGQRAVPLGRSVRRSRGHLRRPTGR